MFPYRDDNVSIRTPLITLLIIAANVAAWVMIQGAGSPLPLAKSVCNLGLVAGELTGSLRPGTSFPMGDGLACIVDPGREPSHLLTHMFLHGSWMHLIGNMWFLWIFGNNVEDSMGHLRFVAFYLACGLAAALIQVYVTPASGVPMVGASGAISGVMGGYVLLYPRARVYTLVPLGFFITTIVLPAWTMIGYWALIQVVSGVGSLGAENEGGVAFWAHVGGLVAGIVLVKLFARRDYVEEHRAGHWAPKRLGRMDWSRR
jgi:membrane associated rhomboid family serine protease